MSFRSLGFFLDELRHRDDLVEVAVPVSARLEVAEIHRRVIAAGGPALLFTGVEGSDIPLVTNLFGTRERARLAFGRRPQSLIRELVGLMQKGMPPGAADLWRARGLIGAGLRLGTRKRWRSPVLEVVDHHPDLRRYPALTSWPEDGGPFVTLPLVYTEHPESGGSNLGMYRLQIHDAQTTGMHWQIGKGGGFHCAVAESMGQPLPVSVFLGGPPALILAAIAPLPENVPELILASLLAGGRLGVCEGPGPHPLISEAEIAMVGHVPPGVRQPEGPFGDHYGYYSLRHPYPVFRVEAIARRKNAIFPATVVGKPRQEDLYIGDELQDLLSPLFPLVMPTVRSLWSYGETGYHGLAGAVVRERYRREALVSAFRILGEGQLSLTKFLFVTDHPVDLRSFHETLEAVLQRTHPETDLHIFSNTAMDTLDYTGPEVNLGSKGVWSGTGEPIRDLPREYSGEHPVGCGAVAVFCGGCLVVEGPRYEHEAAFADRIAAWAGFDDWPMVVVVDDIAAALATEAAFLWTTFTRFEPAADIHARWQVWRNHLSYQSPVVFDARMKPSYPKELVCDPETAKTVTDRWGKYFPDGGVEMGDSDRGHLDQS